ncbi:hypothetical protein GCM10025868_42410 [Angustibacter aerolatus]|uniref:ABC transporter domain-containing protein n=1 Tax=Angustibacter aerolatus TaxID=1162965 RepID=A0ABQ6JL67_9ACTN|nr:hypothetical protein GCM10025868_42410 [Angustibacter aerolatus]
MHALVGQNGAGKSTLVKALTGVNPLSGGHIEVHGEAVQLGGPQDARALGIEIVHQDQPLATHLTVADNMFLGRERLQGGVLLDRAGASAAARDVLRRLGATCGPDDVVDDLTPTQRVQVTIAGALAQRPRVLVLDEPTAALAAAEAEPVFQAIRSARDDGVAVLYISHRLGEITRLADRVTVLRDGHRTSLETTGGLSTDALVTAMVGRDVEALYPDVAREPGAEVLRVRGLRSGDLVRGVDLEVRAGEVVGLAGLVGSGASETLLALFGDHRSTGTVEVDGAPASASTPASAARAGFALVPEERRTEALFPGLSVRANVTAASLPAHRRGGVLSRRRERVVAEEPGAAARRRDRLGRAGRRHVVRWQPAEGRRRALAGPRRPGVSRRRAHRRRRRRVQGRDLPAGSARWPPGERACSSCRPTSPSSPASATGCSSSATASWSTRCAVTTSTRNG